MKNYNLSNYNNNFAQLHSDMASELTTKLKSTTIQHKLFGTGTIYEVKPSISTPNEVGFCLEVDFPTITKKLCFNNKTKQAFVNTLNDVQEYLDVASENYSKYIDYIDSEHEKQRQEAIEKKKQEKVKARFEKQKENAIHKCEILTNSKSTLLSNTEIDWLKQNVTSIKAVMPDYCEGWFIKTFGNVPHKTVDSRHKTSGGNAMKYDLSMSVRVKTLDNIPDSIAQYFNEKKVASNTAFAYSLLTNYDFSLS